jgi:hypothetical protein
MEPIEIRLLYWASSAWDSDAELLEEASRTITELREKLDITTTALKIISETNWAESQCREMAVKAILQLEI